MEGGRDDGAVRWIGVGGLRDSKGITKLILLVGNSFARLSDGTL